MKKYKIAYGGMIFGASERRALLRSIDKNFWPLAEEGLKMEAEAAEYLGMNYGILANSGSSAGLLALCALELPRGSEVIIPATTFPTIFNIIFQCGLVPVVVDSKIGTYNLDPDELEAAIGPKTKAIFCVHALGNPVDMPKVMEIAKKHNLYVLEDNCDGWGGSLNGQKIGSFGHVNFTSFHAAHIVSMGQGGGVFTNDKEIARKVRMYRDWGRQSDLTSRTNNKWKSLPKSYDTRFIYEKMGFNLSPLELQAAMGRVQLKRTDKIKALRRKNFEYLYDKLKEFPQLVMPIWLDGADPSWFAFPLSYKGDRGKLTNYLEKKGIETRSMFSGNITRHPMCEDIEWTDRQSKNNSGLKEADYILEHSFWIGVHPRMTKKDLEYVVKTFNAFFT